MSIFDILVFISLMLLCYASFHFSRLVYGDSLAPLGLFFGVNLASLSLFHLNLLPLNPVSTQAYVLIVISMFSFFWGVLIAFPSFVLKGRPLAIHETFCGRAEESEGLRLFYYITSFIGIVGWIFYVTVVLPPGWLKNLSMLQGNYIFPYHLGYTIVSSALVPPTFFLLASARHKVTLPSVCMLLANIVTMGLCGIKAYLVLGVATSLLVLSATCPGRIRLRHLAFLVACLIGFMILYDHFVDVYVPHQFPGSRFPDVLSLLERPYLYITGPLSAMSVIMADPPAHEQWGQITLLLVWKILGPGGLGIMDWRIPEFSPFVDVGASDANVFTLIGGVYWDYGWLGAIFICILLGFISTKLYVIARKRYNWILYLFSALFSYGLFISFFTYYYSDVLIFLLFYAIIVGYISKITSGVCKWIFAYTSHSQSKKRTDEL